MFALLVKLRLISLWNVSRLAASRQRLLTAGLTGLGVVVFFVIFVGFRLFLSLVGTQEELHELIFEILFFLFLFLLAGAVPFVASTLLHSQDYLLLSAAPVQPRVIVAAKLLDATVANSLQFTMIGIPALAACAAELNLNPAAWILLPVLIALFVLLPALVTALLLLITLSILGIKRVRTAITAVNAVMAGIVCLTIVIQVGRIQLPQGLQHGMGTIVSGNSTTAHLSPSGPFADALIQLSQGDWSAAMQTTGLLLILISLLFAACMQWGSRVLSADTLGEEPGSVGGSERSSEIQGNRRGLLAFFSSPVSAMIVKDMLYVVRDSVLLSQLGMPIILFFVPFVLAIQHESARSFGTPADIYPFAAAMTGIIVFLQTSIISLSSIGLESRSFWLILSSPNGGRTVLWAKFVMSTAVSAGVGVLLTAASSIVFQASTTVFVVQSIVVVLCSAGLCGMGVGISAALPRFVYDNPAHRVSAWALILGFLATIGYLTTFAVITASAWYLAHQPGEHAMRIWLITGVIFLVLTVGSIVVPMAIGSRRLEVYQWEY